jgi:Protein of unknown function (DUF1214)/Sulfatase
MQTIDEEVTKEALRFMNDAKKADKPFFLWWNSTRMHVWTRLKVESQGKTGLGIYPDGMVEHDGHVGQVLDELKKLGLDENTIVMYSTDNGAEVFTWPDGGTTPFRGEKNTNWEGGYRVPTASKDKPLAPDARMKAILTDAAAVANATSRALSFEVRDRSAYYYEGSQWKMPFIGGEYQWLVDGGVGGRNLDARINFFYQYTVNTPAMAAKMVDRGSQYAVADHDKDGNFLDGAKNYKLNIPTNAPAKDFWSVILYDPQTRSELQTGQPYPNKNSKRDALLVNADGSVDLYFGLAAPAGKEKNCVQTVPGKGWFTCLRLYGPLDPWFDKTWRPGEVELVK